MRGNPALSLVESCALIADAVGLPLDRIDDIHDPLPAPDVREHAGRRVQPGQTMGYRRRALGHVAGRIAIEIEWLAIFRLDPEVDGEGVSASIAIQGDSSVQAYATGTFADDPYPSTAARALAAIRPLASMPPGLYRPDQIPIAPRST